MDAFKFTHIKGHHLKFSVILKEYTNVFKYRSNVCILEHIKGLQVTIE